MRYSQKPANLADFHLKNKNMYSSHMNSEALTKPILDGSGLSLSQTHLVFDFKTYYSTFNGDDRNII